MPYNNVIARGDVPVQEETIDQVMDGLTNESASRRLFRNIRVGKASQRFPVLSALPMAYWVNGDTGLKQTSEMAWSNKFIQIEELAVIVPVPQNVLDDSDFDIWAEARPKVGEAIDRALDSAIFFGSGAPASFPTNVAAAAISAGNVADAGASTTAQGGFFGDLDNLIGTVEDDGFVPDGFVFNRTVRGRFRRARNVNGDSLDRDRVNPQFTEFDGAPAIYTMDGLWPVSSPDPDGTGALTATQGVLGFTGDFGKQFILALRKDITYEVFREGVVQDGTGAIVYNLMQQDMVALRVTFRAGWQVANTINYARTTESNRYPAGVLRQEPA